MGTLQDLTGQKFGKLTVVNRSEVKRKNVSVWKCKCDCGKEIDVRRDKLITGKVKSCGCLKDSLKVDLSGKKFGRLKIIYRTDEKTDYGEVLYFCECDCGNMCLASGSALIKGDKKSCGCLLNEMRNTFGKRVWEKD